MLRRCLMLLVLVVSGVARAAAPPQALDLADLGAPSFTVFSVRDGLPASVQVSVRVDRDGFAWAASAEGLVRWDGNRWEAASSLTGVLGALLRTHDGGLWVGFRVGGGAQLLDGQWREESALKALPIRRLAETTRADGGHDLWALTLGDGLWRRTDTRWAREPGMGSVPTQLVSIAATRTLFGGPRLWVGSTDRGLWYRDTGGDWKHFSAPGFHAMQIQDLRVLVHGDRETLWVSTFDDGLWRVDDDGIKGWTAESGAVPTDAFYSLAVSHLGDGDAVLWAATRAGLVRVHGDQVRVFDRSYGLPSNAVRDVTVWTAPDGTEVLWAATEEGIVRAIVSPRPWRTVSLLGARSIGVYSVLAEPDGAGGERLWAGALGDGLARWQDGHWRRFGEADGLPVASVRMVKRVPDADGVPTLWVGTSGGALARFGADGRFHAVPVPWPQHSAEGVLDLASGDFGHGHETWVALRTGGLYRRRDGRWQAMLPDVDHLAAVGLATQVDAVGRRWLWATTSHGLVRYDGDHADLLGPATGVPADPYLDVSLLRDHDRAVLWLGSDHGLVRIDVTDPRQPRVLPDDLPPAPDPITYGALADSRGRVYVCTNNGVQRLTPTARGYRSEVFTRRDGLPHDECNTNAQQVDTHDRYWVGMLGGLGVYDPASDHPDHTPKPLRLTEVRVDGRLDAARPVVLTTGRSDLEVGFALLSWQDEDRSMFRTELRGLDAAPTAWSNRTTRDFAHLPPGRFTLHIEARDYAGNASTPIDLVVQVLPAWWQTAWARLVAVLLAVLALLALYHWQVRRLHARQRDLRKLVDERTAALDAANRQLQALTLRDALTGLANRRGLRAELDAFRAGQGVRTWSMLFVDVDHFKEYNDRWGHPAGDVALRAVADVMRGCAPADALLVRYGGEEFACLLRDTDVARARIVAECIRSRVEKADVPVPGATSVNRITISVGVAERVIAVAADVELLLRDADRAMYRAKTAGRNGVST